MALFPFVTAHTGCMDTKPNTIESFQAGINSGADYVEVDVRETGDGTVILMHDDSITIPDRGIIKVNQLAYDEIKKQEADIPKLCEVLEIARSANRMVNLDIKNDTVVVPLIRTVREMRMEENTIMSGCGKEKAAYIKQNFKGFQVLLNSDEEWLLSDKADYKEFINMTCNNALQASCCGINISYEACLQELVDYAALRCLPVYVYTIDDRNGMEKYIDMGVYSITTNCVNLFYDLVKQKKLYK